MKSIKLLATLTIVLAASVASASVDSYLYWMVDNATYDYDGTAANFQYATISADGGSSYLNLYSPGAESSTINALASASYPNAANSSAGADQKLGVYAGFNSMEAKTFLVELWADSAKVAWQEYTYAALLEDGIRSSSTLGANLMVVSTVTPEPSSALLLLLGMAGLGLKRRRV